MRSLNGTFLVTPVYLHRGALVFLWDTFLLHAIIYQVISGRYASGKAIEQRTEFKKNLSGVTLSFSECANQQQLELALHTQLIGRYELILFFSVICQEFSVYVYFLWFLPYRSTLLLLLLLFLLLLLNL